MTQQVLLPALCKAKPDAVIVIDNLSAHKAGAVHDLLQRSGFSHRSLPPYFPDLNPIELAWAKIKGQLCKAAARTQETLHATLSSALDAQGFFRKAGYATV